MEYSSVMLQQLMLSFLAVVRNGSRPLILPSTQSYIFIQGHIQLYNTANWAVAPDISAFFCTIILQLPMCPMYTFEHEPWGCCKPHWLGHVQEGKILEPEQSLLQCVVCLRHVRIPGGASPKSYATKGATPAAYILHVLVHDDISLFHIDYMVHMNECIHHACCVHTVLVVLSLWSLLTG